VTRIARGNGAGDAVWSAPLPAGATGPAVREGDFPSAAISFDGERVSIFAPFAPGLKQLGFSYSLPAKQFPLAIPVMNPTGVFEVMLEEKSGSVVGARLKEQDPVNTDQRTFRRFLAADVPVNDVATIDLPPPPAETDPRYLVALTFILGAVMIAVLAHALRRR
jgi:hypothetical protein